MKSRLHIQNNSHMAEWPDTQAGQMQARAFRKSHPQFKRRRIRSVIQAHPSLIECGTIYTLT